MNALRHIAVLLACAFVLQAANAVRIRREPGSGIPEYILPTDHDNPALWSSRPSLMTRGAAPGAYAINDIPRTGTHEYLLVLVDFNNRSFSIKDTTALLRHYERVFNEQGYSDSSVYIHKDVTYQGATGSVSDYFRDQSYGQYTPTFRIVGPIHPSKGYDYYGKGTYDYNADALIREICDSLTASGTVDLNGYVRNRSIDQISIIYAGKGANYDGAEVDAIWPHASYVFNYSSVIDSIKYVCTCELFWDSDTILDGIGTFCHEFSHTLGLPDFYLSSASESKTNSAMGYWSLMDYGNYENGGFSPVGYTAFEKYSLGWMNLEEIAYAANYDLADISHKPDPKEGVHTAYRLNTGSDDQFIILENHTKTGWYKYHASQGLMVTSVSYDSDIWNNSTYINLSSLKRYCILPADNDYTRDTNAGDLFPYQGKDSITVSGTPALKAGSSYPNYSIYGITLRDSLVTFYAGPDRPSGVKSLTGEQEISISIVDGGLSVTAPVGSTVTVYDISGKPILQTTTSEPTQQISIPGHGIRIIKCGNKTRKVRL